MARIKTKKSYVFLFEGSRVTVRAYDEPSARVRAHGQLRARQKRHVSSALTGIKLPKMEELQLASVEELYS